MDMKSLLSGGVSVPEFRADAFQALMKILNVDASFYMYLGSETIPPCIENVKRIVFQQARSLKDTQFKYLLHQLVRQNNGHPYDENVASPLDLHGNNRTLQKYNVNTRGFIQYSNDGLVNDKKFDSILKKKKLTPPVNQQKNTQA